MFKQEVADQPKTHGVLLVDTKSAELPILESSTVHRAISKLVQDLARKAESMRRQQESYEEWLDLKNMCWRPFHSLQYGVPAGDPLSMLSLPHKAELESSTNWTLDQVSSLSPVTFIIWLGWRIQLLDHASLHTHNRTLITTLHYACCYDEINRTRELFSC